MQDRVKQEQMVFKVESEQAPTMAPTTHQQQANSTTERTATTTTRTTRTRKIKVEEQRRDEDHDASEEREMIIISDSSNEDEPGEVGIKKDDPKHHQHCKPKETKKKRKPSNTGTTVPQKRQKKKQNTLPDPLANISLHYPWLEEAKEQNEPYDHLRHLVVRDVATDIHTANDERKDLHKIYGTHLKGTKGRHYEKTTIERYNSKLKWWAKAIPGSAEERPPLVELLWMLRCAHLCAMQPKSGPFPWDTEAADDDED
eukprot:TRINITY_DN56940_c0_g1_i1.p1 TRINITY_DN56940_c0_g1~~TRINITY_DN56940_c0_g1_i1.p1  ORF type:complete len:257 (-),score=49.72 TRINITY_DN56940_c0_g1_i1:188-958(-)